ncbi:MAG: phosphoribosylanthranilate isomerase [Ginsengibacter sp.]
MKIKVCGITLPQQFLELERLGADYAGFIFYEKSPRYVLPKMRSRDVTGFPVKIQKTGVFVNASESTILDQVALFQLDAVQLHGNETPMLCARLRKHIKVIKAFRINEQNSLIDWLVKPYLDVCDFYLFDHGSGGIYGGTGKKFNWSVLENALVGKEFFLSGGIGPEDAAELKALKHPFLYAIDINSKFEISPGIKDMAEIQEFIQVLKN